MCTEVREEILLRRKRPPTSRDGADKWLLTGVGAEVPGEITFGIALVVTSLERTRKTF